MKRLVPGLDRVAKRMKALPFRLIGLPGRVVRHARRRMIRRRRPLAVPGSVADRPIMWPPRRLPAFRARDSPGLRARPDVQFRRAAVAGAMGEPVPN